jgi:hypothetical protein
MNMNRKLERWCILPIVFMLVSCNSGVPTNIATHPLGSPLISPVSTLASTIVPTISDADPRELIPTQSPTAAQIEGTISMEGSAPGVFHASLLLGDPTGSSPVGAFVALDVENAPRGYVGPDGTFVFPNVSPGTYVIVAWTPLSAYTVPDQTSGNPRIIEIKGNEHLNVGHINVPTAQGIQ